MKNYTLVLVLLFVSSTNLLFAQGYPELGLEGGGGVNTLRDRNSPFARFEYPYFSWSSGIYFTKVGDKSVAFKTGIYFNQKSVLQKFPFTDSLGQEVDDTRTLNQYQYLGVPFLIQKRWGSNWQINASLGAAVNFLVRERLVGKPFMGYDKSVSMANLKGLTIDIAGVLGIGLTRNIDERLSITLDLRDEFDFLEISGPHACKCYKSNVLILYAGVKTRLGYSDK